MPVATGLIIKNCIPVDSIRVTLQGRAMIITQKGQIMSSQARLGNISKEPHTLGN